MTERDEINQQDDDDLRACDGAEPFNPPWGDMVECRACRMNVRCDLAEHPFFGFKSACTAPRRQEQR